MRVLRATVQALSWAMVLLKAVGQPVVVPAEARLMPTLEYVLVNDVAVEPKKAVPLSNALDSLYIERFAERLPFLIKNMSLWSNARFLSNASFKSRSRSLNWARIN